MSDKQIEHLESQIETLMNKDQAYRCFEKEISDKATTIRGLERVILLCLKGKPGGIELHNAKILWNSYLTTKSKREREETEGLIDG